MRRLLIPASALLLGVGLALWQGRMHGDPPAAGGKAPPPDAALGVASCASAACHHGNGDLGKQGSEYSTFVAVDPHARAFQALYNADSKLIQKNLGGGNAHENPLCLMCHGLGAGVPQALHADGAGCEQCHGPAGGWKTTHYRPADFNRDTAPGFRDLRKLDVRAETCMKCHVGDGSREVNHDLIAAGHPRLKFEYAAYYANYPRHWTEQEKKERALDPAREARNWLQGQTATAKAALELLAVRAENKGAPWPEFAEHDCTACHHGLTSPSERQKRAADRAEAARKMGKTVRSGDVPWSSWYTGQLPLLASRAPAGTKARLDVLLQQIDDEMKERLPNRKRVGDLARQAAGLVGAWSAAEMTANLNARDVRGLIRVVGSNAGPVEMGWDGGTQAYLGIAALNFALKEMGDPAGDLKLKELRGSLRESFPAGSRPLYESPSKYDAAKVFGLLGAARMLAP